MKPDLSVKISGIKFENPFLLASAPPTADVKSIRKAFSLGWGGAVLKTIVSDTLMFKDASPRFAALHSKNGKEVIGFENIELLSHKPLDYWISAVRSLKSEFPAKILIASIMAPVEKSAWQNLVLQLQESPIDAFELNFSCPHGMPEKGIGMAIGTYDELSAQIAGWVKEVSKLPIFVKLSPNVTDITKIAKAVEGTGIEGITAINTVQSMIGVDLDSFTPLPNVEGFSTFGGYSGRAVKPIGLRCVAQIKRASELPLLATGGISSWRDAAEYIALGASAVQICTEVMLCGYGILENMLSGLSAYLEEKGFSSLDDLRGRALKKISTHENLNKGRRELPQIDKGKCHLCERCVTACDESGYKAVGKDAQGIVIDSAKCDRCSLCRWACPFGAISM